MEDIAPGRRQEPGIHPDWGSAFIQIPWYMYLYYGDTAVMREHYDGMREFLSFVEGLADGYIVSSGYGDWCPPGQARPKETPVAFTSSALFHFEPCSCAHGGPHRKTGRRHAIAPSRNNRKASSPDSTTGP